MLTFLLILGVISVIGTYYRGKARADALKQDLINTQLKIAAHERKVASADYQEKTDEEKRRERRLARRGRR